MRKNIMTIIILLFVSCSKDEPPGFVKFGRTVIVYMAADNDLSSDALIDLEEMKHEYVETGVNLIVLTDATNEAPCLIKIMEDSGKLIY